jgi:outer membrane protein assembly factor BamB
MTANVMERNWVVVSVVVGMLCTAATVCGEAGADGRIGFRGDGTGSFPDANPPVKWSATENVIWKTPMPGRSNSAPIVVGDRIFTCSEPGTLLCVSSTEGKILWSDTVTYFDYVPEDDPEAAAIIAKVNAGKTEQEKEAIKESLKKDILRCDYFEKPPVMGSHFGFILEYTLPTPTSDGKQVYVVYGTGLVAAYDLEGKRTWVRGIEKPRSATGYAASPLVAGGRLVINMGGYLHGLDPASGKMVWKMEQEEYYGSPVRAELGGTELVVVPMGNVYRASDGKLLGKGAAINSQLTASVHGDTVYSAWDESFNDKKGPKLPPGTNYLTVAVRLKPNADGTIATEKLWEQTARPGGYSSPIYLDGLIYNKVDAGGHKFQVVALDAATGQVVCKSPPRAVNRGTDPHPCITHAGPYIYGGFDSGQMWVFKPGREFQEVATNTLAKGGLGASLTQEDHDQMTSPPFFVGSRMYLRTHRLLWCIGGK